MVPRTAALVCGALALAVTAACTKAQAVSGPSMPMLAPPDVPPRVIAEYEPDPPLPAEPVSTEAVTSPPPPARPPRREPSRASDASGDGAPAPAATVPTPPPPALALQMPAANAKADQSVRAMLSRAARDLERVDYRQLDADRRAQYDTAKGFMQQAEDALKVRNVMFAGKLADKAATMAAALVP
jgi:hypothetical protein